jgi:hypothetical protein
MLLKRANFAYDAQNGEKRKTASNADPDEAAPKPKKQNTSGSKKARKQSKSASARGDKPQEKLYDAADYCKPKQHTSWIWNHFDLHRNYPGWVQCKFPLAAWTARREPVPGVGRVLRQHVGAAPTRAALEAPQRHDGGSRRPDGGQGHGNPGQNMFTKPSSFNRFYTLFALWIAPNNRKTELPVLVGLARRYLCMMATSSSVERLFSTGGNVITKKRCAMEHPHGGPHSVSRQPRDAA